MLSIRLSHLADRDSINLSNYAILTVQLHKQLDTLLVHVVPPKVEEESEEEEVSAEAADAAEAGGEADTEKKADEGAASDGDK